MLVADEKVRTDLPVKLNARLFDIYVVPVKANQGGVGRAGLDTQAQVSGQHDQGRQVHTATMAT